MLIYETVPISNRFIYMFLFHMTIYFIYDNFICVHILHRYVTFMNFYIWTIDLYSHVASDQIISSPMFSVSRLMLVPTFVYNVFSPVIVN